MILFFYYFIFSFFFYKLEKYKEEIHSYLDGENTLDLCSDYISLLRFIIAKGSKKNSSEIEKKWKREILNKVFEFVIRFSKLDIEKISQKIEFTQLGSLCLMGGFFERLREGGKFSLKKSLLHSEINLKKGTLIKFLPNQKAKVNLIFYFIFIFLFFYYFRLNLILIQLPHKYF